MECPICYQSKNVIMNKDVSGSGGINSDGIISGNRLAKYKCTKCYCKFSVDIKYIVNKPTIKEIRKEKIEKINEIGDDRIPHLMNMKINDK